MSAYKRHCMRDSKNIFSVIVCSVPWFFLNKRGWTTDCVISPDHLNVRLSSASISAWVQTCSFISQINLNHNIKRTLFYINLAAGHQLPGREIHGESVWLIICLSMHWFAYKISSRPIMLVVSMFSAGKLVSINDIRSEVARHDISMLWLWSYIISQRIFT